MKKLASLIGAGALAAATLAASPAQAATYEDPQVFSLSNITVSGETASVTATYQCWGGNEGTHVWVSLKQGPQISPLSLDQLMTMEGTSALAKAYYDTNVVDPSTLAINCNGEVQTQTFTLGVEKGALHPGLAFAQFCLFDSTAINAGPENTDQGFAFLYDKVNIKRGH